ncbi:MAG: hypothetical protein GYA12_11155 [Chloroflexi bacterium]|nr:hypothetical protein [Chloroflexota bacterium]
MGKKHKEEKKKLTGGWGSLQAVIWLLGLAVIAWQGWWWPGILILVAISVLYEAVIEQIAPGAFIKEPRDDEFAAVQQPGERLILKSEPAPTYHRTDLLPTNCPRCGAPTRGHDTHWTGPQSANCSYCGSSLPMKKI